MIFGYILNMTSAVYKSNKTFKHFPVFCTKEKAWALFKVSHLSEAIVPASAENQLKTLFDADKCNLPFGKLLSTVTLTKSHCSWNYFTGSWIATSNGNNTKICQRESKAAGNWNRECFAHMDNWIHFGTENHILSWKNVNCKIHIYVYFRIIFACSPSKFA